MYAAKASGNSGMTAPRRLPAPGQFPRARCGWKAGRPGRRCRRAPSRRRLPTLRGRLVRSRQNMKRPARPDPVRWRTFLRGALQTLRPRSRGTSRRRTKMRWQEAPRWRQGRSSGEFFPSCAGPQLVAYAADRLNEAARRAELDAKRPDVNVKRPVLTLGFKAPDSVHQHLPRENKPLIIEKQA